VATRAERSLIVGDARAIAAIYRQSRALIRSLKTGEMPAPEPGWLDVATPAKFVCAGSACAGETMVIAVKPRQPDPACPRCGRQLRRGSWSKRSERAAAARRVNCPQVGAGVSSGGDSQAL